MAAFDELKQAINAERIAEDITHRLRRDIKSRERELTLGRLRVGDILDVAFPIEDFDETFRIMRKTRLIRIEDVGYPPSLMENLPSHMKNLVYHYESKALRLYYKLKAEGFYDS